MPVARPIGVGPIWVGPIGPSPAAAEGGEVTDTVAVQLPVNCVIAGQQRIHDRYREHDIRSANPSDKVIVSRTTVTRLKGMVPSFSTKTGSRGYD